MKKLLFILSSIILFMSCSFVTDSEDSESTVNTLVGTWNLSTVKYFDNPNCNGDPFRTIDVNSLVDLYQYGLDEYKLKAIITKDLYIIVIRAQSLATSNDREENSATGILVDHGDRYCVIWDTEHGDECDGCRDYTINGDELEFLSYDCPHPDANNDNVPCQIFTLVKQ